MAPCTFCKAPYTWCSRFSAQRARALSTWTMPGLPIPGLPPARDGSTSQPSGPVATRPLSSLSHSLPSSPAETRQLSSELSCELCNCCHCYSSVRHGSELCCRVGAYLQVAVHLIQSLCLARCTIQDSATIRTYSQELAWQWCWVRHGKYLMKCSWRVLRYILFILFLAVYIQCTLFGLIISTNLLITTLVIFGVICLFQCITQFRLSCLVFHTVLYYSTCRYCESCVYCFDIEPLSYAECKCITKNWITENIYFLSVMTCSCRNLLHMCSMHAPSIALCG